MLNNTRITALRSIVSNPRHYPAAVLALAGVAVGVAPLTATAATSHTPAKPATAITAKATTQAATVKGAAPAKAAATAKGAAPAAPTTVAAKAAATAGPFAGASTAQLAPTGTVGAQSHITLDSAQWANATAIVHAAEDMHLTPYAATIAVATSMQESKLKNLDVAVDHDSLGLFQQRPSCGWGTPAQLENPTYAAKAFLKNLPAGYQNMPLHTAAQDVQDSFNGSLYAQWENQATHIVSTIANN